ncbi:MULTISPECIES: SRPBCC domain-containing protein [unclassified Chryseobacterium]|uniref:SRPBCC domain-containing protein n=1 Tax=unclassified Chryseobacterium TaxID=2593645 RepID=UPI00100B02E4|nr:MULTISPECIES: SRPBCC domain-containing protein [unclassified Chryseobacterium]RXM50397.1 ATPase [Chryseobacterium sp. CH25]RXM64537.1 ATPase [Chryseobacterium sp. CH1]
MEQLSYEIEINAEPEKVWSVLWSDITYRQWTTAFTEGSFYEGALEENSIVKFLDPKNNGMYSRVIKVVPNETITFLHLGEIYEGIEVAQEWGDATEAYFLEENDEGTLLRTVINTPAEFKSFFEEKFPKAMNIVKHLSENQL